MLAYFKVLSSTLTMSPWGLPPYKFKITVGKHATDIGI